MSFFTLGLKAKAKSLVHHFQETLKANQLSKSELQGIFQNTSCIKLFKGSFIEVPFSLGRTIRGTSYNNIDLDPWGKCLLNQDLLNFDEDRFATDLYDYYLIEKAKKVDDFINIGNRDIQKFPSWTIAYPWEDLGFYDLKRNYLNLLAGNRREHLKDTESIAANSLSYSLDYAKSHARQFKILIAKITNEGFNKSFPRPRIFILKNNNNWRWSMAGNGNHRAYVMFALNNSVLPVAVSKVVDRSKSEKWPNVVNGEYTQKEAEHIFDIIFKGDVCVRGSY